MNETKQYCCDIFLSTTFSIILFLKKEGKTATYTDSYFSPRTNGTTVPYEMLKYICQTCQRAVGGHHVLADQQAVSG